MKDMEVTDNVLVGLRPRISQRGEPSRTPGIKGTIWGSQRFIPRIASGIVLPTTKISKDMDATMYIWKFPCDLDPKSQNPEPYSCIRVTKVSRRRGTLTDRICPHIPLNPKTQTLNLPIAEVFSKPTDHGRVAILRVSQSPGSLRALGP